MMSMSLEARDLRRWAGFLGLEAAEMKYSVEEFVILTEDWTPFAHFSTKIKSPPPADKKKK